MKQNWLPIYQQHPWELWGNLSLKNYLMGHEKLLILQQDCLHFPIDRKGVDAGVGFDFTISCSAVGEETVLLSELLGATDKKHRRCCLNGSDAQDFKVGFMTVSEGL